MKILIVGGGGREHALAWRFARDGHQVLAGTIQCSFRQILPLRLLVRCESRIESKRGRRFQVRSLLVGADGGVFSESTGTFVQVPPDKLGAMRAAFPAIWREHSDGPLAEGLQDVDFFLTVARSLLEEVTPSGFDAVNEVGGALAAALPEQQGKVGFGKIVPMR